MDVVTAGRLSTDRLVERLGDPHRRVSAYRQLLLRGADAAPAVRRGLTGGNPLARAQCARFLDHVLDEAGIASLIAALDDPEPSVRVEALHALACDRCKGDSCRPEQADVLPPAIDRLTSDPSPRVRAMAAELVGAFVHTAPEALSALRSAQTTDPSTAVRKKVGWYLPGGTIHESTRMTDRRPNVHAPGR